MAEPALSIVIPANNEASHIQTCLSAILAQEKLDEAVLQVIVAANGCSDDTAALAREMENQFAARGWTLTVLDIPEGSKPGALNCGDMAAYADSRAYLDADIVLSPHVLARVLDVLGGSEPVYVTGRMQLAQAKSWISRHYGSLWMQLPFMRPGTAQGAGFYAVNPAGRARWEAFPEIIADDGFARWSFVPEERVEVDANYFWPLVEGFSALVRVRRRQDAGGVQLRRLYPALETNEGKPKVALRTHLWLALTMPVSYSVYVAVQIMVRQSAAPEEEWARGAR